MKLKGDEGSNALKTAFDVSISINISYDKTKNKNKLRYIFTNKFFFNTQKKIH